MQVCFSKKSAALLCAGLTAFWFITGGINAQAQGLTLSPTQPSAGLGADDTTIALIAIRLILVLTLLIAGMFALINGYNWLNSEGNTKKAKNSKIKLGKALIVITSAFFLLILYRVFVPDYSILSL